jgi:hypothetical protein
MESIQDYFECDGCRCKAFKRIYHFSVRFHGVNFSDDLIYDELTDELYQCTECSKTFTKEQIEEGLARCRQKRKKKSA